MFAMSCQKNIVAILMIPLVGVICCISYHTKKMPRSSTFADMTTLMTTATRVPQKKHNYFNTSTKQNNWSLDTERDRVIIRNQILPIHINSELTMGSENKTVFMERRDVSRESSQVTQKNTFSNIGDVDYTKCQRIESFGLGDEEKKMCMDEMPDDCLVFSIGSNNAWGFEEAVFARTKCRVHTFDCTGKFTVPKKISPRVTFHHKCIASQDADHIDGYGGRAVGRRGSIDDNLSWDQLVQTAGGKTPHFLKMDIEGWEWVVLNQIIRSKYQPRQIAFELHVRTYMPIPTKVWIVEPITNKYFIPKKEIEIRKLFKNLRDMDFVPIQRRDNVHCMHCSEILIMKSNVINSKIDTIPNDCTTPASVDLAACNYNETVQKVSTTSLSPFKTDLNSIVKKVKYTENDDKFNIARNCKHLPSSNLHKCRKAISHALKVDNITCPQQEKCVTFDQYGRLNNFITELNTAVVRYVLVNNATKRKNIHIPSSLISILNLRAVFDEIQLSKVCVSFSFSGHCEKISAYSLHKQNLWNCNYEACLLANAWLSFASLKSEIHTKVSEFMKYGKYSSIHARFLEDECEWRHKNPKKTFGIVTTPDYCRFEVSFIMKELKKLGHRNEPLWLCSDRQQMHKVGEFTNKGIAKISPFHIPVYDSLLMINSEYFLGNAASTLSLNVYRVRSTFGKDNSHQILL